MRRLIIGAVLSIVIGVLALAPNAGAQTEESPVVTPTITSPIETPTVILPTASPTVHSPLPTPDCTQSPTAIRLVEFRAR